MSAVKGHDMSHFCRLVSVEGGETRFGTFGDLMQWMQ